jgi:hypothetical protein
MSNQSFPLKFEKISDMKNSLTSRTKNNKNTKKLPQLKLNLLDKEK